MDFARSEAERQLAELCRGFAQKEIAPRAPRAWDDGRCPTDLLREMGGLGLLCVLVPEQRGGIGVPTIGFVAAMEELGSATDLAGAFSYLASDASRWTNGSAIVVDGGYSAP
jgi:alkylation response protein AidB-like acyl-CoA dehydrogenase